MPHNDPARLGRRAALLLPMVAALSGCDWFDDIFSDKKPPLPGKRVAVLTGSNGLTVDPAYKPQISLPAPFANPDWPQPGGTATHEMGHLALPDVVQQAWRSSIGSGGGYRRKIMAQPVISGGRVFTMDSAGNVSAFDVANGGRIWDLDTQADDDRSGNLGGGVSVNGDTLFASTGRGELLAVQAANGEVKWRKPLGTAARAAPTLAEGRAFVPTLDDQLLCFAQDDGRRVWAYQASNATTSVLGLPSPAYAAGLVIAGFGTGDMVALRADSGVVAWSDTLAGKTGGAGTLSDLTTIRGLPVIVGDQVYGTSIGGLTLDNDVRSGRRLWDRAVGSYETPCVAGDWLFMVSTDQQLAALSRSDGQVAWVTDLPRWENEKKQRNSIVWRGPVLAGDRLILAGTNAQAISVSPYTGKILGTQDLSDKASVPPIVAGNTVYLVTDAGTLIALR
ncbi:MAG TPA: PQQ-binding-like beta-propeller repeat protein [Acetobacteraceae bacterium]|jgi:outer membrane protein assembly factor BamB|nr:PQQ-binding-like beta-propeller repeat protein [Acetobacteraceae bacterium]